MRPGLGFLWVCAAAGVYAQSGIGVPRAGCVLDGVGRLGQVRGVAGAFVPGKAVEKGVIAAACSEHLSVVKTEQELQMRDGELRVTARRPAPGGAALFAFLPNGSAAYVYYPTTHGVVRVDPQQPPRPVTIYDGLEGDVLAIAAPDTKHIAAVVRSGSEISIVRILLATGKPDQVIPLESAAERALLLADGTLVAVAGSEVMVRRSDRTEHRFTLSGPAAALYLMNDRLAGIVPARGRALIAVRLERGREQLLRVPEAVR